MYLMHDEDEFSEFDQTMGSPLRTYCFGDGITATPTSVSVPSPSHPTISDKQISTLNAIFERAEEQQGDAILSALDGSLSIMERQYIVENMASSPSDLADEIMRSRRESSSLPVDENAAEASFYSSLREIPSSSSDEGETEAISVEQQVEAIRAAGGPLTYEKYLDDSAILTELLLSPTDVVRDYYRGLGIDQPDKVLLVWEGNRLIAAGGPRRVPKHNLLKMNLIDATLKNVGRGLNVSLKYDAWLRRIETIDGYQLPSQFPTERAARFDMVYDMLDAADIQSSFDSAFNKFKQAANEGGRYARWLETSLSIKVELASAKNVLSPAGKDIVDRALRGDAELEIIKPDINTRSIENLVLFRQKGVNGRQVLVSLNIDGGVHEFENRDGLNWFVGKPENERYINAHVSLRNQQNNVTIAPSNFGSRSALKGFQQYAKDHYDASIETDYSVHRDNTGLINTKWNPNKHFIEDNTRISHTRIGETLAQSSYTRIESDGDTQITSDAEYWTHKAFEITCAILGSAAIVLSAATGAGIMSASVGAAVSTALSVVGATAGTAHGAWTLSYGDTEEERAGGIAAVILEPLAFAGIGYTAYRLGPKWAVSSMFKATSRAARNGGRQVKSLAFKPFKARIPSTDEALRNIKSSPILPNSKARLFRLEKYITNSRLKSGWWPKHHSIENPIAIISTAEDFTKLGNRYTAKFVLTKSGELKLAKMAKGANTKLVSHLALSAYDEAAGKIPTGLLKGLPDNVVSAGYLRYVDGKISITNISGHYRPSVSSLNIAKQKISSLTGKPVTIHNGMMPMGKVTAAPQ